MGMFSPQQALEKTQTQKRGEKSENNKKNY